MFFPLEWQKCIFLLGWCFCCCLFKWLIFILILLLYSYHFCKYFLISSFHFCIFNTYFFGILSSACWNLAKALFHNFYHGINIAPFNARPCLLKGCNNHLVKLGYCDSSSSHLLFFILLCYCFFIFFILHIHYFLHIYLLFFKVLYWDM